MSFWFFVDNSTPKTSRNIQWAWNLTDLNMIVNSQLYGPSLDVMIFTNNISHVNQFTTKNIILYWNFRKYLDIEFSIHAPKSSYGSNKSYYNGAYCPLQTSSSWHFLINTILIRKQIRQCCSNSSKNIKRNLTKRRKKLPETNIYQKTQNHNNVF